ncbi:phosphate ABC transporter, permease protein PstA [bacterium TMED181]|nr:phosphate ABC transporter, permease protein PstA [Planctomycetota bacterium]OUW42994.1 MAG: phosphate ABC transporter, permease protein PstA [bacterium TMED181]
MSTTSALPPNEFKSSLGRRRFVSSLFKNTCAVLSWLCIGILGFLLVHIVSAGWEWVSFDFLKNPPSRMPEKAGLFSALMGTIWIIVTTACISIPIGVCSALYLEEYARKNRLNSFIEINIANLAGVPSIVYGILGLTLFVRLMKFGPSVLTGSLTLSLLILPVIIIASREAIKAVPSTIRLSAYALGATRFQTVIHHVLPAAMPGIMTGVILALSRAIGETAPILMVGAVAYVRKAPSGILDGFTALPIQIYNWAREAKPEFEGLAAGGIIVLLVLLFTMNSVAILIRNKTQKAQS